MRKNNIILKILCSILVTSALITYKANAINIDAETNNLNKVWTIKFNKEVNTCNLDEEIVILDENKTKIPIKIELEENNTLLIYPPEGGYKDKEVYTLKIGKNIKSQNKKNIKSSKEFTFKVDAESLCYNNGIYEYKSVVENNIESVSKYIIDKGLESDWEVMALAKANKNISKDYINKVIDIINDGLLMQPTDYQRTTMLLSALGENPIKFNNVNFLDNIYNNKDIKNQGPNAVMFALIALDSGNYEIPNNSFWSRESLINTLLEMKTYDGGWDFAGIKADPDMTGMALTALHNYTDDGKVKDAVNNAINLLSDMQNEDGTFSSYKIKNSESISQVIIGLCANGIDPTSSEFTKSGKNLIDALLTFKSDDGGFKHIYEGNSNGKATEQALLALEAYKELKNGRLNLYEF
ncbi:prenyltransferase/squalene oxidase repeat-containing protein [Clostridium ihumii]|uniref:prenyltransferase/squalene oxidase repeat-containing protein n=1 Tax=Clostridium ihumii TaxID=1470356 RepID=UPI000687A544|nr:prenyltransferase/squalene oxidase repeat-containing protein [Clostridium ihumii]